MKEKKLTHVNKKEFSEYMPESLVYRLCLYLREKNLHVRIIDTYCSQAGWKGFKFIINGTDLSGNGFCFNPHKLSDYLFSEGY